MNFIISIMVKAESIGDFYKRIDNTASGASSTKYPLSSGKACCYYAGKGISKGPGPFVQRLFDFYNYLFEMYNGCDGCQGYLYIR